MGRRAARSALTDAAAAADAKNKKEAARGGRGWRRRTESGIYRRSSWMAGKTNQSINEPSTCQFPPQESNESIQYFSHLPRYNLVSSFQRYIKRIMTYWTYPLRNVFAGARATTDLRSADLKSLSRLQRLSAHFTSFTSAPLHEIFGIGGASIYDVRKIFGILDPSPHCQHLGLIYSTKFTQPPLLHLLLG